MQMKHVIIKYLMLESQNPLNPIKQQSIKA